MSTTNFEQNDGLDGLSSEELEERAFGPDPSRKRKRRPRRSRKEKTKAVVPVAKPPPVPAVVVTKFCYACGAEVDARAEVCPACGVRQPEVPSPARRGGRRKKSKGAASLLALTLGGVGAHRFYLGQPKVGLALLLFCWTFIPVAVGFVDFLRYVFMSDRRFTALYEGESSALLVPPRPVQRLARVSGVSSARPVAAPEERAGRDSSGLSVEADGAGGHIRPV